MGLKERRLEQEIKAEKLPYNQSYLDNNIGIKVIMDVDWSSFENNLPALEQLRDVGLNLMYYIITGIAKDDIGKEAIQSKFSTICLINLPVGEKKRFAFENQTLQIFCDWNTPKGERYETEEFINQIEDEL